MKRNTWLCVTCKEQFTRRFSANRHNNTFHAGKGFISRLGTNLVTGINGSAYSSSRKNSLGVQRYGPVNPFKDQQRENNLKIRYISSKEQIGEPYSRYASMLKSSDTIEGNPDINIKLANKYIKIQELDALLSMLGPSQDAKNIRSAAIGVDNLEFLDGVITGIRNLVRTRRFPLS